MERWIIGSLGHSLFLVTEGAMDRWIDGSLDHSLILGTDIGQSMIFFGWIDGLDGSMD